jgi:hypothetical protein
MKLANKHKVTYNGTDYLVDVYKEFYSNVLNEDHYVYYVDIFSHEVKENIWIKRIFYGQYKFNCLCEYKTNWIDYFKFKGDIDKVINESFRKMEWNLKEQKYISEKESKWKEL